METEELAGLDERWLSIREVAELAGLSERRLRYLVADRTPRGRFPGAVRKGARAWLVDVVEVRTWLSTDRDRRRRVKPMSIREAVEIGRARRCGPVVAVCRRCRSTIRAGDDLAGRCWSCGLPLGGVGDQQVGEIVDVG